MSKPKVAFFDFASCEGCQLTVLTMEDQIPQILELVEIVNFREAISDRGEDYSIAFIEGSITRPKDIPRIKAIRRQADVVVALGACAATGGVNALKNSRSMSDYKDYVYKQDKDFPYMDTFKAAPVDAYVKVDFHLHGCPIVGEEFLALVKAVILGKSWEPPKHAVCVECKMNDTVCMFERGETCVGPITRGGCGAICPSFGQPCNGCRGMVPEPNINSAKEVLTKNGISIEEAMTRMKLYNNYGEVVK
jgi:coenzyme F420-reducing hydrogenase gamma subunit